MNEAKQLAIQHIQRKMQDLSDRVTSLRNEWVTYKQGKRNDMKHTDSEYLNLRDRLDKIKSNVIEANHEAASAAIESFATIDMDTIETEMDLFVKFRDLTNSYSVELDALSTRPWVSLRNDLTEISEFVVKWERKLAELNETFDIGNETFLYLKELGSIVSILTYCTGEVFKEVHWTEFLQGKLLLPIAISIENLQLHHFLEAQEILLHPKTLPYVEELQNR